MASRTPHAALLQLQRWINERESLDGSVLLKEALNHPLPKGPFETVSGERLTPVQALARHWETLEGVRSPHIAQFLLNAYPATQTDPMSLGELLMASERPVSGNSSNETKTMEEEERNGLDALKTRCENLLELLPQSQQAQAHAAMASTMHRCLEKTFSANPAQALRRWLITLNHWFGGPGASFPPAMPGYFSWNFDEPSPISLAVAKAVHVVTQAVTDDQELSMALRFSLNGNHLLSTGAGMNQHGLEAFREARLLLARELLGGLSVAGELPEFPTTERVRAAMGLNAITVVMETSAPDEQIQLREALADVWPAYEAAVHRLQTTKALGLGLTSRATEASLVDQLEARSVLVLNQAREQALHNGLPTPHPTRGHKPRF